MLDLASLPRGAFASALEYNLERFESLPKVCDHFLFAVSTHLGADAVWLRRALRENRPVAENYSRVAPRLRDEERIESFLKNERPEVPRNLLLAPVRVNGRLEAVIGAERHGSDFERGQGWSLNRLANVLAQDLSRREEERLARVLDSIKGKVVSELRPRELAEDLERARRFQSSLLPRKALESLGWHVEGRLRSCDAVGGDLFLALPGADGLSFAVTDVSGHGVRAAMYAGMLLSLLDTARRRNPDPEAVEVEISSGVDFFESGSYATVFFGGLGSDGRLRYFNAGHPPPLLLRASGELEELRTAGVILAPLFADSRRRIGETSLAPGDRLLAFTDGVYESFDPGDHQWGLDALRAAVRETRALPPGEALDAVMKRVLEHASGRPASDDQTLVVVDRTGT
jgi:serine phosphatase RsbU (regulator of sigma subunit)